MNVVFWFSLVFFFCGFALGGPILGAVLALLIYGFGWVLIKVFGDK